MAEIIFASGRTSGGEPCVYHRGIYLPLDVADRLVPLLGAWAPDLSEQLSTAIAEVDQMEPVF